MFISPGVLETPGFPCNPLLYGWRLNISWQQYLFLYCLPIALAFRVAHSWFRALAVRRGDFPGADRFNIIKKRSHAFLLCLIGFNKFKEHSDLWIPSLVGYLELSIFPILITLQQYGIIGAWLGIKTAGSWMGYSQSRTSFNRFLLFNILTVLTALALSLFVDRLRC